MGDIEQKKMFNDNLYEKFEYHCKNFDQIYTKSNDNETYVVFLCGFLCECVRQYKMTGNIEYDCVYNQLLKNLEEEKSKQFWDLYTKNKHTMINSYQLTKNDIDDIYNSIIERIDKMKQHYGLSI